MAEEVIRRCDFRIGSGRKKTVCGKRVENDTPTEFTVGGSTYEVDLCSMHEKELVRTFQPFVEIAKRTRTVARTNARGRKVMRTNSGKVFTTREVRTWLEKRGEEVAPSGRIPNSIIEEYERAH